MGIYRDNRCNVHGSIKLHSYLLLIVLVTATAQAQIGLSMTPMRSDLKLSPKAQTSGPLFLSNDSGERTRVRAQIVDFFIDDNGTPQFGVFAKEAPYSCREWLTVNPMEIDLEPKQQTVARYTLRVPENVAPGANYHCSVQYVTVPKVMAGERVGMRVAVAVAPVFYVQVGESKIDAQLKALEVQPPNKAKETGWMAVAVIENRGLVHCRANGKIDVLDKDGKQVEQVDIPTLPILPKRTQMIPVALKTDLSTGDFTLVIKADLGTSEIQGGRVSISSGTVAK